MKNIFAALAFAIFLSTCDMTFIGPSQPETVSFLTITGLPPNTLPRGVSNVHVYDRAGTLASTDGDAVISVDVGGDTATLRIPLIGNDSAGAFTATGTFFVSFTVNVDALTDIEVAREDGITVDFLSGSGSIDVADIPGAAQGRFPSLTITGLPPHTKPGNISNVFVHNLEGIVAYADYAAVSSIVMGDSATIRIPLIADASGAAFTDTGTFFVGFVVNVDALIRITVAREDGITVLFQSGNGSIDVSDIPDAAQVRVPHLTITGLPTHTQLGNVSSVFVYNRDGVVAVADYANVSTNALENSATLRVPLLDGASGTAFTDTGTFLVGFVVNVDALIRITVAREDGITVFFQSGNGSIDVSDIPDEGRVRIPHLTISGLPAHTQPGNVSNVFVYNQQGTIAIADYAAVIANASEVSATLRIPLIHAITGEPLTETGNFFVGFDVNVDALMRITVTREDGVTVLFASGNGSIDISDIPIKPQVRIPSLTITGLPPNTIGGHFMDFALWNTAGRVARIDDREEVSVSAGGNTATAVIPLTRQGSGEWFRESGVFLISFDISVDALTRITLTREQGVTVALVSGSGSFSLSDIPSAPQEQRPYLTVTGLPTNTRPGHFSDIALWNSVGRVARIDERDEITVSVGGDSATAKIPLARQTSDDRFQDSGVFIFSFDLSVDALTRITLTRERGVSVALDSGNGSFDISEIPPPPQEQRPYLTLTGLPPNALPRHFSDVALWNSSGRVARVMNHGEIVVSASGNTATARIPLTLQSSDDRFRDTGVFFLSFDLNIDAMTRITLARERAVSVILVLGNGSLDVSNIPDPPREQRPYLTLTGLPPNTQPAHFSDIALWNTVGRIARLDDRDDITVSAVGNTATAKIPLTRQTSDEWFQDSGVFILSFDLSVDALTRITLTREQGVSVSLNSGSGLFDVSGIPSPPQPDIPYLAITGLPANTQPGHFSNFSLWSMAGRVARVGDNGGITVSTVGNTATARIPLTRQTSDEWFRDSGVFLLSFDLSVDAFTRITVTREQGVSVSLNSGSGSFDVSGIPAPPPVRKPYLTIAGLPANASPIHFSNIGIWNATHQVAGCWDTGEIEMSVSGSSATASIPLTRHDSEDWFRDTGTYVITFTANIDALTRIERTRANNVTVVFSSGNGRFDIPNVTGVTVNPTGSSIARGGAQTFTATVTGTDNPPQEVAWSIDQTGRHAQTTINAAGVLSVANAESLSALTIRATSTLDNSRSGTATVNVLLPTVTGVTVSPATASVTGGGTRAFAATVNGANNPSQGVYWSIVETGRHAETTINTAGVLSVANAESLATLTVRATSTLDASGIGTATVTVPPPPSLTISGLPVNTTAGHFSDVALWNAAGRVARVRDPGEISVTASGDSATARIPLTRHNSDEWFRDTGTYIVAFTVNADALNRIVVTREDGLTAPFTSGNGSFNVADIPAPLQVERSYLTIGSLPANTGAVHFTNIGVWNATHQVAGFREGGEIEMSLEGGSATAKIPLTRHDSEDLFRDTGTYVITFTANIDALTRIERTRANNVTVIFDSGNGRFDIPSVTGVTVNPGSASVARSGMRTFTATVNGTNSPPQGVTWSIDQAGRHAQTTINSGGVLTVAALENTATLTIRATSTLDPSRSGTATVTVLIPTVTGVTVNPATVGIERGRTQTFTATVNGANNPAQGVTWSIVEPGRHSQTTINSSGLLTVAATETTATLTVRATSTFDTSRSGTATVTVLIPTVTGVTVSPATASVARGGTQSYTATVNGTNNPAQTVTWSIVETGRHTQTTISSGGVLTVAAAETLAAITVRATSTFDTSRSGTATATVLLPTVTGVTVTPATAEVQRGGTRTFAASVAGTNSPPQTVTWSIDQTGRHAQTTVNSSGVLSVASAENLTTLTVRATSTLDAARSGTATVTVPLPPMLTITGLPENTAPNHFSNIGIWTGTQQVARSRANDEITVSVSDGSATARIPLTRQGANEWFRDSGSFIVTFTANIDAFTRVERTRDDGETVTLTEGSGTVAAVRRGFFNGGLRNPDNTAVPTVRSGTVFEMNGSYHTVGTDAQAVPRNLNTSSMAYVYAIATPGGVTFELLSEIPAWNAQRNGWYTNDRRALFRAVHVRTSATESVFWAKTSMTEDFANLSHLTMNGDYLTFNSPTLLHSFAGDNNPAPQTITLQPGVYAFSLSGGGGGGGMGVPEQNGRPAAWPRGGGGGSGGRVIELVTISRPTEITVYTGAGGGAGGNILSNGYYQDDTDTTEFWVGNGGNGGAAAFVYSPALSISDGYFLTAAGGGGGAGGSTERGRSPYDRGISGFPGGVIGRGSGSGTLGGFSTSGNGTSHYNHSLAVPGFPPSLVLFSPVTGIVSNNHRVYVFNDLPPFMAWLNTNGAEAWGGINVNNVAPGNGQNGGNNRNNSRGGGGVGGVGGNEGVGTRGGAGFVHVYVFD